MPDPVAVFAMQVYAFFYIEMLLRLFAGLLLALSAV